MDTPTALLSALERLSDSVDQLPDLLTAPLIELGRELESAVSDYVGMQVTVLTELGMPIALTHFGPDPDLSEITTSLRLPLAALTSRDAEGHITFYSGRSGAFVDLAADLSLVLGSVGPDGTWSPAAISLDEDLKPAITHTTLVGIEEASIVNRAIGLLIGQGRSLDEAHAELLLGAQEADMSLTAFADATLRLAQPAL